MHGVIVPPPPPKESLKLIEEIQKEAIEEIQKDASGDIIISASKSLENICVALDRYMKRLFR